MNRCPNTVFNVLVIVFWNLFEIWCLRFGILLSYIDDLQFD
ncbi:hypothetical protein D1AOALGA4SA_9466 [Olavius algarvensis Delta 1 endosymbiont]|nr:hypothetical protein D1AOALGA4SA_9466 [Olavius algarvensis Delta 1 endosymbiont]